jgi:hypothetical protein
LRLLKASVKNWLLLSGNSKKGIYRVYFLCFRVIRLEILKEKLLVKFKLRF